MFVKMLSFLILKNKLNEINFNNNDVENSLKKQFSSLFELKDFNEEDFNNLISDKNKEMLQKNIIIHRDYSNFLEQVNKSFKIAVDKNNSEIELINNLSDKKISEYLKEFAELKKDYSNKTFNIRINNETIKSEHYSVFEEEISQINKEIKERKDKFIIEQNKLDHNKNNKLQTIETKYNEDLQVLYEKLDLMTIPFNESLEELKAEFNNEQQAKDDAYLTIKKNHNQASIKLNDFIKDIKKEYNIELAKEIAQSNNNINDLKIEIEDLYDYFEKSKEIIQLEYSEKIKALDIVFDVQRNDHNKNVQEIITNNANEVSNINANFRETRNNLNNKIKKIEQEKNQKNLKTASLDEKKKINAEYRRETDLLQKQILKLNQTNEFNLIQQDIVFQTKIYNQDLKHLKHVNEWRYTKDVYEKERNNKLSIEHAKYTHELFIIEEKINYENKKISLIKEILNNKLEKKLLPIESQLFFTSLLQTRDINLLNLEFESFKFDNELKNNLLKLNKDLEETNILHEIELIKANYQFETKIININHQLNTEKAILERDSDLEILNLNTKLQETLLNQKNLRQENLVAGKINYENLQLEKEEKITDHKIKNERKNSIDEQQKRNFSINEIQTKNQKNINYRKSLRTITISKHETEFNYSINKEITTKILNLYTRQHQVYQTFNNLIKSPAHPNVIRSLFELIGHFNDLIVTNAKDALKAYINYGKESFTRLIDDFIQSKYQTKHEDIINMYSDNISQYLNNIKEIEDKISALNNDIKLLETKNEKNLLVINSLMLAAKKQLSINERKQVQLLNDEILANKALIANNLKIIKDFENEIKRFNTINKNLTKQQSNAEERLFRTKDNEKKYYEKLYAKYELKHYQFRNYLSNYHVKFVANFNKLNQGIYLDDKNLNTLLLNVNKLVNKHYEEIINHSFKLLSFWQQLYLLTKKNETKVINRFNKSADLASKENINNYNKSHTMSDREVKFNNRVFNNEITRIDHEIKKINDNTSENIQITHNQYNQFYIQTENQIKHLKHSANQKLQIIKENLDSVINTLNNNKDKTLFSINKDFNRNKTNLLTDIILTNEDITTNVSKTNSRTNIIISRYDKNRRNHLEDLKERRNSYNNNIKHYNDNINLLEETFNVKVRKNLKKVKARINELELQFNLDKVTLRKVRRKESRSNRKKLKHALKFKNKQIKRKKK